MELEERVSTQSDGSLGDRREEGDILLWKFRYYRGERVVYISVNHNSIVDERH